MNKNPVDKLVSRDFIRYIIISFSILLHVFSAFFIERIGNENIILVLSFTAYVPVFVFSFYFGLIGGILSSLFLVGFNIIIDFGLSEQSFDTNITIAYYITILMLGTISGYIFDLYNKLKLALHDKEILLSEIHHRIKNNLSLITDMIRLESRNIDDECSLAKVAMVDLEKRIKTIGIIHEKLYNNGSLSRIDYYDYVKSLTDSIIQGMVNDPNRIKVFINIIKIDLEVDTTIPIGLIITETVTNAIKYGFPNEEPGEIRISLTPRGRGYLLEISNNGKPLAADFDSENKTLGLRIIKSLAKQLNGYLRIEKEPEVKFCIEFEGHNS